VSETIVPSLSLSESIFQVTTVTFVTLVSASWSVTAHSLLPPSYIAVSVASWTASLVEYYTAKTFEVILYISITTQVAIEIVIQDQPAPEAGRMSSGVLIGIVCGGAAVLAIFAGLILYVIKRGGDAPEEFTDDGDANALSTLPGDEDDPDADGAETIKPERRHGSGSGDNDIDLRVSDTSDEVAYI
jgi:hypothetical protein